MDTFLDQSTRQTIQRVVLSYKTKRDAVIAAHGITEKEFKKIATDIRKKAFTHFEKDLKIAVKRLADNGFQVHPADTAQEARKIITSLIPHEARVVKAKTNTGREIQLDSLLTDLEQKQVIATGPRETDLGDYLVELFGTEDMHYVLPAIHLQPNVIAEKIATVFGDTVAADPASLTAYLCGKIRAFIVNATVGITGANFFTQTGQVVLLENEGNISLVSRIPARHIIVVGIDKLTFSVEDAVTLAKVAATFGTGQPITQYISIIGGPSKTADIQNEIVLGAQGAKEVHIVLVDNGRRNLIQQGLGDLLRCINCGACINFCPAYHHLGARYGGTYLGSKGLVLTALARIQSQDNHTSAGLAQAKAVGSFDCTECGNCSENCPMGIDLASMVRTVRSMQHQANLQTPQNVKMIQQMKTHGNPFGSISEDTLPDRLYCC